jgi:hypothetical protein
MQNLDLLTRPLYFHDGTYISEGKRIGAIHITELPQCAGKWIGEVTPYGQNGNSAGFPDHTEGLAMARLFAAATDMLKYLILMRDHVEKYVSGDVSKRVVLEEINAIIKKATE